MILLLDNYDSFTYNLVDYFHQLGATCRIIRNDAPLCEIIREEYTGIVISPGPETPGKAGRLLEVIAYYEHKLPILGICLGHQALGEYYGANLVKAARPMHGKISKITLEQDVIFNGMPSIINVVRYNSLIIEGLPSILMPMAYSSTGEIMAVKHNDLPVWGVQFHPEAALTEYGLKILKNWLDFTNMSI